MNNEDIHTLSGAYAVDAVDDVERARFEKHLTSCEACQTEVAELRAVGAALADLSEVAPPPELRAKVLAGISTVRPLPPPLTQPAQPTAPVPQQAPPADATEAPDEARRESPGSRFGRGRHSRPTRRRFLAAAAAVVALGGVGALAVTQPWEQARPTSVAQQVESARDAQRATAAVGSATATVVRSASLGEAVLITHDMPPVPSGKVYQAWLQAPDGTMTSAGLMADGSKTLVLRGAVSDAKGVGITVEPSGGSPQPTTTPVALISLT